MRGGVKNQPKFRYHESLKLNKSDVTSGEDHSINQFCAFRSYFEDKPTTFNHEKGEKYPKHLCVYELSRRQNYSFVSSGRFTVSITLWFHAIVYRINKIREEG